MLAKRGILFGSFVKGDIHEGSDIDLLIIEDFQKWLPQRHMAVVSLTSLPIQPFIYTPAKLKQQLRTKIPSSAKYSKKE
jgi:hypothetical protein